MNRESTGFARTLGVYFTIAFAALQALDVMLDRLGLPERLFAQASVVVVLLLPAAVAVGLIRRLLGEEDAPVRVTGRLDASWTRRARGDAAARLRSRSGAADVSRWPPPYSDSEQAGPTSGSRSPETSDSKTASASAAQLAEAHLRLARLYDEKGDADRAAHHYERYVAIVERRSSGSADAAD